MTVYKKVHIAFMFFIGQLVLFLDTGCIKEYSYEGGPHQDTIVNLDTLTTFASLLPTCTACSNTAQLSTSTWTFRNGTSLQCGTITAARINAERNALTFFGPSSCSKDTGLILTAYFATQPLDRDRFNLPADKAEFEYYDNITPSYILKSWLPHQFFITIDKYAHSTRIASGTFRGFAFTEKGDSTQVEYGRFKIIIP